MQRLRYTIISGGIRPMAYKRPSEHRFTVIFAITLIALLITIVLSLQGII